MKRMTQMIIALFMAIVLVGCGNDPTLTLKQNELILEYGEYLPKDLMKYIEADSDYEDVEYSSQDIHDFNEILEVGEYSIDYHLNNQKATMKVKVQDTTAPLLTIAKEAKILQNEELNYNEIVNIEEKSNYTSHLVDDHVNYQKAGTYQAKLYVVDDYGNESSLDIPVCIEEVQLKAEKTKLTLTKNKTQNLNIKTNSHHDIEYKSNNEKVATVDGDGNIKAISKGTAIISACVNGKTTSCEVVVNEVTSPKKAPTQNTPTSTQHHDHVGTTVYITNTGNKYHRAGCRYLKKSQQSISKNNAVTQGYEACKVCKP